VSELEDLAIETMQSEKQGGKILRKKMNIETYGAKPKV